MAAQTLVLSAGSANTWLRSRDWTMGLSSSSSERWAWHHYYAHLAASRFDPVAYWRHVGGLTADATLHCSFGLVLLPPASESTDCCVLANLRVLTPRENTSIECSFPISNTSLQN